MKVSAKHNANSAVDALAAAGDIPTGDDFFDDSAMNQARRSNDHGANNAAVDGSANMPKQFYIQKVNKQARTGRNDVKVFDQSLVDLGITAIMELQKLY